MKALTKWQRFFAGFVVLSAVLFAVTVGFVVYDKTSYVADPCADHSGSLRSATTPFVKAVRNTHTLVLGAPICVTIEGLGGWLSNPPQELALYVNQEPMKGLVGTIKSRDWGRVQFSLVRNSDNAATWTKILGAAPLSGDWNKIGIVPLTIGVGPAKGAAAFDLAEGATAADIQVQFLVLDRWALVFGFLALLAAVVALMILGSKTPLLRDGDIHSSFSLARCQMAFWLVLITASFIYIWLVTGDANNVLTPQALVLLGISATTGLAAMAIDAQPAKPDDPKPLERGKIHPHKDHGYTWLRHLKRFGADLLSSPNGTVRTIQLHRVQILVWTLILGCIFLWEIYRSLAMPAFDTNLLIMMGISGGLYIGFKTNEKPAQ